jgi:hypothetical protein
MPISTEIKDVGTTAMPRQENLLDRIKRLEDASENFAQRLKEQQDQINALRVATIGGN